MLLENNRNPWDSPLGCWSSPIKPDEFNACSPVLSLKRFSDYLWKSARRVCSGSGRLSQTPSDRARIFEHPWGKTSRGNDPAMASVFVKSACHCGINWGFGLTSRFYQTSISWCVCEGNVFRFSRIQQKLRWWGGQRKFWGSHLTPP